MLQQKLIAAALLSILGVVASAPPNAARAQGNPPVLNGEQRDRTAPLPPEVAPKPPVATKVYARPATHRPASAFAGASDGFDLSLRQVRVPADRWFGLIRSSGANHEQIAARIGSLHPQTDLYWSGHVAAGSSVIVSAVTSRSYRAGSGAQTLNAGASYTLAPSVDRSTGALSVQLTNAVTTLTDAPAGALPRQDESRRSYPVSLKNGIASALAQTLPVDAAHIDVVILTATISGS